MAAEFPRAARLGAEIEHLDDAGIRLRLTVAERHLRPGGKGRGLRPRHPDVCHAPREVIVWGIEICREFARMRPTAGG